MVIGKIFVSKDVIVNESTFWNWDKKKVEAKKITQDATVAASSSQNIVTEMVQLYYAEFDDLIANTPTTKTKSLAEVYEK